MIIHVINNNNIKSATSQTVLQSYGNIVIYNNMGNQQLLYLSNTTNDQIQIMGCKCLPGRIWKFI